LSIPKFDKDCGIAAWDRIGDDASDRIERDIVYAESPDEVCDIADMFLMWISGEDALEEPASIMHLTNMPYLLQCSNCVSHDGYFLRPITDVLDCDGGCVACVNNTFIILAWYTDPAVIKDGPVLFNEVVDSALEGNLEM